MSQKQGGKGKQSSQSDKNYWARLKAAGGISKRKRVNIAKQCIRASDGRPCAGGLNSHASRKISKPREPQRVVFSNTVKDQSGIFLHRVTCDGILLEISPRLSDAADTVGKILPGLPYHHDILNPLSGRVESFASRPFN